jgi:hypothetical protein
VPERHEALGVLHRAGALTGRVDLLRYAVASTVTGHHPYTGRVAASGQRPG